jgi:beta-lactam-binding protein with PASTA domain
VVSSVYSSSIAAGLVIAQFPAAGASVNLGTVLEVTLSLGVAPTLVPDLGGLDVLSAAAACVNAGIVFGAVRPFVDGNNSGLIVNQSIAPGTQVTPGTVIDVAISTNKMPLVRNVDYVTARLILRAANLDVDDTSTVFEFSDTIASTFVIDQSPSADAIVTPLTKALLTVSLGALVVSVTVLAIKDGYFDEKIRKAGEMFEITDPLQFSPYWMQFIDTPPDDWLPLLEPYSAAVDREILTRPGDPAQMPEPFRGLLQ